MVQENLEEGLISYLLLIKFISQAKKEVENYLSKTEDYNPGTASQKASGTVLPIRDQNTVK